MMNAIKEDIARAQADILEHGVTGNAVQIAKRDHVTLTGDVPVVNLVSMVTVVRSSVVRGVPNATKIQAHVAGIAETALSGKTVKEVQLSQQQTTRELLWPSL